MNVKRLLLFLIVTLCCIFTWAQKTYSDIITYYPYIDLEKDEVCIPSEPMEITGKREMLVHLLDKDMYSYFDLNDKYPTPLQKNTYKRTQEYAWNLEQFNADYKATTTSKFYILKSLQYNTAYDINKRCFYFRLGVQALDMTKVPGYIGLTSLTGSPSDVCITFPSNRLTVKKELTYDGSDYWISQYIRTPIISEELAMRIEKGMEKPDCPISLMFIVIPQRVSKEIRNWKYGQIQQNFILAKTVGLYIVDTQKETILCDLSKIFTSSVKTPRKK